MKTDYQFDKRFTETISYLSVTGLLLLIFLNFNSNAQIVYTDIPDEEIANVASYDTDIINGFEFTFFGNGPDYTLSCFEGALATSGSCGLENSIVTAIDLNTSIGPSSGTFFSRANCSFGDANAGCGEFPGVGDKYVGIRIEVSTNNYKYGWIRVNFSADGTSFIVKDYAIENTANTAIMAGDTGGGTATAIDEFDLEDQLIIYPNPAKDFINIRAHSAASEISITDVLGNVVLQKKLNDQYQIDLSLEEMERGFYNVILISEGQVLETQKLLVQ